ncbi:hypothetical protein [Actinomadura sp. 9N407]|uniref:hypothetical protein n=1 Tax=Actinomadura sp. 9N407 TaxID=3375154 RepID=UPI0037AEF697
MDAFTWSWRVAQAGVGLSCLALSVAVGALIHGRAAAPAAPPEQHFSDPSRSSAVHASPDDHLTIGEVIRRTGVSASTLHLSAANVHDSQALKPLVMALPAIRSRRGPRRRRPVKIRADQAHNSPSI